LTKLYLPPGVPSINRDGVFYHPGPDGAIDVPSELVNDFIAMGCTLNPAS